MINKIISTSIKFWWLIAIIAVLLFGVPQFLRPALFVTTYPADTVYQWQGISWAYPAQYTASFGGGPAVQIVGVVPSTAADGTLKLSKFNAHQEYGDWFKKSSDISGYTEILLTIRKEMRANTVGDAHSSALYRLIFDGDKTIDSERVFAERVGGGSPPAVDAKTSSATFLFKQDSNGWTVSKDYVVIAASTNKNPELYFAFSGDVKGDGTSQTDITITGKFKKSAAGFAPTNVPGSPLLSSFIATLKSWLQRVLDAVPFLAITGSANPVLGTSQTYAVSLAPPTPLDVDYADGTYAVRYCNVALMRSDGTVISEKGFEACTNAAYPSNAYTTSFTVNIPSQTGKYAVAAVMVESKGTFDTAAQAWAFAPYEIIAQEALNVETKAPLPGASLPLKPTSGNVFAKIWASLFGWLFR